MLTGTAAGSDIGILKIKKFLSLDLSLYITLALYIKQIVTFSIDKYP